MLFSENIFSSFVQSMLSESVLDSVAPTFIIVLVISGLAAFKPSASFEKYATRSKNFPGSDFFSSCSLLIYSISSERPPNLRLYGFA